MCWEGVESNINITLSFIFIFIFIFFFFFHFKDSLIFVDKKIFLYFFVFYKFVYIKFIFRIFFYKIIWFRIYNIFSCIFFGFITYFFLIKRIVSFLSIIKIVSILSFIHVIILLVLWFFLDDPINYDWMMSLPFFNHIRNLSDFLSVGFFCSLFLVQTKKGFHSYIWYFVSIFILSVIIWSGSRSAYLSILISYPLWLFYVGNKIKNLFYFIFSLIVGVFFSIFFKVENGGLGFLNSISRSYDSSINKVSSGRVDIYIKFLEIFSDKPFFGIGGEAVYLSNVYAGRLHVTQAHNSIIQILIEFGILGFIALLFIFYNIFLDLKSNILVIEQRICVVIVLNIFLASLVNGGFYYVTTMSLFSLFSIFVFCLYFIKNNSYSKMN